MNKSKDLLPLGSDEKNKVISSQEVYDGLTSLSKESNFSYADWSSTDSNYFGHLVGSETNF